MPSTTKRTRQFNQPGSPFSTSFNSAVRRGTPVSTAVSNIARNTGKTPAFIYTSLYNAGQVYRQKFNNQWIYWPTNGFKRNTTGASNAQINLWQSFVEWALASGFFTPQQLKQQAGSKQSFLNYLRKYFSRQFGTTPATASRTSRTTGRRTTSRISGTSRRRTTGRGRTLRLTGTRRSGTTATRTTSRRRAA